MSRETLQRRSSSSHQHGPGGARGKASPEGKCEARFSPRGKAFARRARDQRERRRPKAEVIEGSRSALAAVVAEPLGQAGERRRDREPAPTLDRPELIPA